MMKLGMDQDERKPRLATDLPAPRQVSAAEMAQATSEARELRAKLDRATAGMETLHDSECLDALLDWMTRR